METVENFVLVVLVLAVICVVAWAVWGRDANEKPVAMLDTQHVPAPDDMLGLPKRVTRGNTFDHDAIMRIAQESYGGLGWFHARIAGVTYRNNDGTSRQSILGGLRVGAALLLRPETSHLYEGTAFAMVTRDGQQVGFLPSEVAADMAVRYEHKERYIGILLSVSEAGRSGNLGALVGLLHIPRGKARDYGLLIDDEDEDLTAKPFEK